MSLRGVAMLACVKVLDFLVSAPSEADVDSGGAVEATDADGVSSSAFWALVAVNVVTFFTFNQMSFLVLTHVHVVTHAMANSFRRVVTVVSAIIYFGTPVGWMTGAGMVMVSRRPACHCCTCLSRYRWRLTLLGAGCIRP